MAPETWDALYEAGLRAWPAVKLERSIFARHMEGLPTAEPSAHGADLYLACACIQGETCAMQVLEREHLHKVPLYLTSLRMTPSQVEEVQQQVRVKLLAPPAPKLCDYSGRGALRTFIRTVSVNTALHLLERAEERKRKDLDDDWFTQLPATSSGVGGAELQALRRLDRVAFKETLQAVLQDLRAEERNLLRLHFLEGMTMEEIGAMRRVHKATISRELKRLREGLLREVQRRLQERCRLAPAEIESMMGFLGNQLDLSLSRILAEAGG